jgi:hypothetical protein
MGTRKGMPFCRKSCVPEKSTLPEVRNSRLRVLESIENLESIF